MSKRIITSLITSLLFCCIFTGCGGNDINKIAENNGLETIATTAGSSAASIATTSNDVVATTSTSIPASTIVYPSSDVDVDLTLLSSTMVYSEVYNMLMSPYDYVGKTVRMNGMFVTYVNEDNTKFYPAVIIADATACCAQGIEFVLVDDPSYPDGYPALETDITVVGTFEMYTEDGYEYCHLVNAVIE